MANHRTELALARSGAVFAILFMLGLVPLAGFVPPVRPDATAVEVAKIYQENANSIRLGLILTFLGTIFFFFFASSITAQTARIRSAPRGLIYTQLTAISAAAIILIIPITCWWVAAFRPDTRPADDIQLINDLGWMIFVIGFTPWVTWMAAMGLAILADTEEIPLFPRWSGYFCLLIAVGQIPPVVLPFFKTGPLAWNGVIGFYAPLTFVFIWVATFIVLTGRVSARSVPGEPTRADLTPTGI